MKHETELHSAGTFYGWSCSCGRQSRHLALQHRAISNARAHERKYNAQECPDVPHTERP